MYLVSLEKSSTPIRSSISTRRCGISFSKLEANSHSATSTGPSISLQRAMTSIARSGTANSWRVTRILPSVSVPVLSVQIVVTEPSVSTARSLFTSPLRLRILRIPITSITVTAIRRPSGIAAIASTIETRSISRKGRPDTSPTMKMAAVTPITSKVRVLLNALSRTWSGVSSCVSSLRLVAILPSSVWIPVAVTSMRPRPVTTVVPMNTWFAPSSVFLLTGSLSPVRIASSTAIFVLSMSLPSPGTRSPAARTAISPGTSSRSSISRRKPSRMTVAVGLRRFLSEV